jgi:hypothetical protein
MKTLKHLLFEVLTVGDQDHPLVSDLMRNPVAWPSNYYDVPRIELEVPVKLLQATQKHVNPRIVAKYRTGTGDSQGYLPEVVLNTKTGKYLIIDGHHRVVAEVLKGLDPIKVEKVGEIAPKKEET